MKNTKNVLKTFTLLPKISFLKGRLTILCVRRLLRVTLDKNEQWKSFTALVTPNFLHPNLGIYDAIAMKPCTRMHVCSIKREIGVKNK